MMNLRACQLLLIVFCTLHFSKNIRAAPGFVQNSGMERVDKYEEVTFFWELVDVQVRETLPMAREFFIGGRVVLYYDQSAPSSIPPGLDISYVGNETFIGFFMKNVSLEYAGTCKCSIDLTFDSGIIITDSSQSLYVQTAPMTPTINISNDPIAEGATTIICTADSLSMPEERRQDVNMIYSWMIDPPKEYLVLQNNTNNHVNGTIIVEDLKKNETLEINCTASEDGSSFEAVQNLELIPFYAPGAVVAVSSNVTANVGDEFILQVTSEDKGYPEGNFTWQFPNGTVQKDKPNQLNLTGDPSHSGNFTCYLENVVGVGDSATILVTIKELGGGAKCEWWCILLIVLVVLAILGIIIGLMYHYRVACFRSKCCPWSSNRRSKVDVNDVERTVTSGSHGNKQDAVNKDSPYRPDGNMPQKGDGSHGLQVPQGVPVTNSDQKRPMPSPGRKTVLPPLEDPERSKKKKKKNRKSREEE